ncbi:MAG: PaaI family thioesterase [Pseudomonadota bacterium]|nr:PaaI family thioesterase [Pseudomonadota bacterium]
MSPSHPTSQLDIVRHHVQNMPMARTLDLRFESLLAGQVVLSAPVQDGWCHAPGQLQATALFALADFAAVASAATLLPAGWANSTVDATIKLLAPARGNRLRAHGRVVQPGKTLSVCAADVYVLDGAHETLCATLLGTARNFALAGKL